nr:hypothetical protein [Bacteroidota bacterium]
MNKKILLGFLSAILFMACFSAKSQTKRYKFPEHLPGVQKQLVSSTIETSTINFTIGDYILNEVKINGQAAFMPQLEGATPILRKGAPELLKLTASVIIPDDTEMQVKVISTQYTEYAGVLIAPSKGNIKRDQDPASVPYAFGEVYQRNEFFPGALAELREPYIM